MTLNDRLTEWKSNVTAQRIIVSVVLFLIGGVTGFTIRGTLSEEDRRNAFFEQREGEYRLINPLLECDIADNVLKNRELRPFKEHVENFLKNNIDGNRASGVTVYFRELNDGMWFSIGDAERFIPASLRKLPLMIALLKQAETRKGFLARKVRFHLARDHNVEQNIKPSRVMVPGREYTVGDLVYRMIVYSDNNAFTLLAKVVDPELLQSVYSTLTIKNPRAQEDDQFLSVQTYASFFRILYNATYLDREMSDWALDLLSQSEFRSGLVAGVPPAVAVAHKFGEHSDETTGNVQLHDCGIVYYPRHPYLLCLMSKGASFEYLDDVIGSISHLVYAEVDEQHRKEH